MYPKKTKYAGILLRSKNSIQIIMYFGGERETETLTWEHTPTNLKECYGLKLTAEKGFKEKSLNYAQLFPHSKNRFKYISHAGDSLTIHQRLTLHYNNIETRYKNNKITFSTKTSYHWEINRLLKYFEKNLPDLRLSELRPHHLTKWALQRNVTQKSINEELKHIRSIIQFAINEDHIEKSILVYWSPKVMDSVTIGLNDNGEKIYKPIHEKNPFTKKEVKKILDSTLIIAPAQYSFILISFALGLRPGEVIGLQWKRYNEIKNEVHIMETVVLGKLKLKPKTPAGERRLTLNEAAKEAINIQKKLTYENGGFIFTNPLGRNKGKLWNNKTLSNAWVKILSHAGIPHRPPYNTRHTYATLLLEAGMGIYAVSKLLGHADPRITMSNYIGGKNDEETALESDKTNDFITLN